MSPEQEAVAVRLAKSVDAIEDHWTPSFFNEAGKRLEPDSGRHRAKGATRARARAAYIVEPHKRPSPGSCRDMVQERVSTGQQIVYDEARWQQDPRVEEQAGPSVFDPVGTPAAQDLRDVFADLELAAA
jgi:hypothetical protein